MSRAKLVIDSEEAGWDEIRDGRVVRRTRTYWLYRARVFSADGRVVWADDGGDVRGLLDDGFKVVAAVRVLEAKGHQIESWTSVVDHADWDW